MVDFWWQIFCQLSPGKIGLKFVTENFTAFFSARKEICHLQIALEASSMHFFFCLQSEASCLQLSFFAYNCFRELSCLQLELLCLSFKPFCCSGKDPEAASEHLDGLTVSKKVSSKFIVKNHDRKHRDRHVTRFYSGAKKEPQSKKSHEQRQRIC